MAPKHRILIDIARRLRPSPTRFAAVAALQDPTALGLLGRPCSKLSKCPPR